MKVHTASFFSLLAVLGAITAVSSCSKTDYVAGMWQGNPERIADIPGTSDASSTMTIDSRRVATAKARERLTSVPSSNCSRL